MTNSDPSTHVSGTGRLPTIAERPGADIVIYDGDCRFCQGQVERLHRYDWLHRLAFVSLHDPVVSDRWSDVTHDALMQEMYVMTPDGRRYAGAAAIRYLSRRLPPLWTIAGLLHLPGSLPLWRFLYAVVARHRYRLRGKTGPCEGDTCAVHFGERRKG